MGNPTPLYWHIDGDYITNFVREKYKETGDVSIAVSLLTQMLIGIPVDIATAIILGNKKLVGMDEVTVEDDCAEVVPYGIIRQSDPEEVTCGWIAPDGLIFGHREYNNMTDHHLLAIEICKRLNKLGELEKESLNEEWDLEKLGYLKFQPNKVMAGDHPATDSQKYAIAEICKAHNIKMQIGWSNPELYSGPQIAAMDLIMFNKHLNRT